MWWRREATPGWTQCSFLSPGCLLQGQEEPDLTPPCWLLLRSEQDHNTPLDEGRGGTQPCSRPPREVGFPARGAVPCSTSQHQAPTTPRATTDSQTSLPACTSVPAPAALLPQWPFLLFLLQWLSRLPRQGVVHDCGRRGVLSLLKGLAWSQGAPWEEAPLCPSMPNAQCLHTAGAQDTPPDHLSGLVQHCAQVPLGSWLAQASSWDTEERTG